MQAAQEKAERQGLGVSKEGQQIFDCFYKTMPCKWQGKTISVMGEVSPHSAPCALENMLTHSKRNRKQS